MKDATRWAAPAAPAMADIDLASISWDSTVQRRHLQLCRSIGQDDGGRLGRRHRQPPSRINRLESA
eukprot:171240-Chlamydomonas_euryale.AAC.1